MSDLTDDELTVLLITERGAPLFAIGRWEKPIKALAARGLLRPAPDGMRYEITDEGREAALAAENDNG
jgi:hypothetical protein